MSLLVRPQIPDAVRGWSLWVPPPTNRDGKARWINLNERSHWGGRSGKTAAWRTAAQVAAKEAQIPFLVRVWVQALFYFGDTRRRDVSNWTPTVKACVDGFTDAGLWSDDRDGILVGPDLRRGSPDPDGTKPFRKGIEFLIFEVTDGN